MDMNTTNDINKNNIKMIISSHELSGKIEDLKEPFVVLEKKNMMNNNRRDDDDDDDDNNDTVGTGMESLPDETLSATATDSVDCKEDFAISHLAVEILHVWVNRTKDSVKRQVQQVKLILQPLLHTGDVAWRQIKSSFEKVQKRYKDAKNQSSSSPNKQMEELAEPTICDDPLSNSA